MNENFWYSVNELPETPKAEVVEYTEEWPALLTGMVIRVHAEGEGSRDSMPYLIAGAWQRAEAQAYPSG